MKNIAKRILALVLSFVMVLTSVPTLSVKAAVNSIDVIAGQDYVDVEVGQELNLFYKSSYSGTLKNIINSEIKGTFSVVKGNDSKSYLDHFNTASEKRPTSAKEIASGRYIISVETKYSGTKTWKINVKEKYIPSTNVTMEKGDSYKLNVNVNYNGSKVENNETKDTSAYFGNNGNKNNVAYMASSETNTIRGNKIGTCTIELLNNNKVVYRINVTVNEKKTDVVVKVCENGKQINSTTVRVKNVNKESVEEEIEGLNAPLFDTTKYEVVNKELKNNEYIINVKKITYNVHYELYFGNTQIETGSITVEEKKEDNYRKALTIPTGFEIISITENENGIAVTLKTTITVSYMLDGKKYGRDNNVTVSDFSEDTINRLAVSPSNKYSVEYYQFNESSRILSVSLVPAKEKVELTHKLSYTLYNNRTKKYEEQINANDAFITKTEVEVEVGTPIDAAFVEENKITSFNDVAYDFCRAEGKTAYYKAKKVNVEEYYPVEHSYYGRKYTSIDKCKETTTYYSYPTLSELNSLTDAEKATLVGTPSKAGDWDVDRIETRVNNETEVTLSVYYKTAPMVTISYVAEGKQIATAQNVKLSVVEDLTNEALIAAYGKTIEKYEFDKITKDNKGNIIFNYKKEIEYKVYELKIDEWCSDIFLGKVQFISGAQYAAKVGTAVKAVALDETEDVTEVIFKETLLGGVEKYYKMLITPDAILNVNESYNCNKNGTDWFDGLVWWGIANGNSEAVQLNGRGKVTANSVAEDQFVYVFGNILGNTTRWAIKVLKDDTPVQREPQYVNVEHKFTMFGKAQADASQRQEGKELLEDENEEYIPVVDEQGNVNEAYDKFALEGYTVSSKSYDEETNTITFLYKAKEVVIVYKDGEDHLIGNNGNLKVYFNDATTELPTTVEEFNAEDSIIAGYLGIQEFGGIYYNCVVTSISEDTINRNDYKVVTATCTFDEDANTKDTIKATLRASKGITKLDLDSELALKEMYRTELFENIADELNDKENIPEELKINYAPFDSEDVEEAFFKGKRFVANGIQYVSFTMDGNYNENVKYPVLVKVVLQEAGDLGQFEEMSTNAYDLVLANDKADIVNDIKEKLNCTISEDQIVIESLKLDGSEDEYGIVNNTIANGLYNETIKVEDNGNVLEFSRRLHVLVSSKRRTVSRPSKTTTIKDEQTSLAGPIDTLRTDRPNDELTRSEFVGVLGAIFSVLDTGVYKPFADIAGDANEQQIKMYSSFEIVKGYCDEEFGANDAITREQMYLILARALKFGGKAEALTEAQITEALAKALDGVSTSEWATEGVAIAIEKGLVGEDGVKPLDTIKRVEAADKLDKFVAIIYATEEEAK